MNKIIILTFTFLILLFLASCQKSEVNEQTKTALPAQKISEQTDSTRDVKIQNFAYNPEITTIKKGESVTWKNYDSAQHTATSQEFDSLTISEGKTFTQRFDKEGIYEYYCSLHPNMKGRVAVE